MIFELVPEGDSTGLTQTLRGKPSMGPVGAVFVRLMEGQVERDNQKSVDNLAALAARELSRSASSPPRSAPVAVARCWHTCAPMADDRLKRTRYDPAAVEGRVFSLWEDAGVFHPEPGGDPRGELLDRDPAAQRDRLAPHGPRPERHPPGRVHAGGADARPAHQVDLRHRPRGHRHAARGGARARGGGADQGGPRPRGLRRARLAVARAVRVHDHRAVQAAGRLAGLRGRALHDGSRVRPCRHGRVRGPLREGLHLPRQLHGQLGSRPAHGDLRPRGGAAHGRGHALPDRLSARVGVGRGHGGHGPARDDAGRHRDRGEPDRRALLAPDRRGGDPAAGGPPAADPGRRLRGPRVRHRRAQDHAGARPERLRDRPPARARGGDRDRRGRADHGCRSRGVPRHGGGRGARGGGGRAPRGRGSCRERGRGSTTCRTRTAPDGGSSR